MHARLVYSLMDKTAETLITLGVLFILGLATDMIGRRTRLPRVTLLLIFGFAIGPAGLNFLSPGAGTLYSIVTNMALVMVGFLLGEKLTFSALRRHGRYVLLLSVAEVIATALVMLLGLLLIGVPVEIALLLAGIATATDPAAVTDVVKETNADGIFTRTLLGIVAVDDAWGLIVFSLLFTAVQSFGGQGDITAPLLAGAWELGGALFVGFGLGIPMAYLTGRIKPGEPTLIEALGIVFLCGGIAIWLHVSFLFASMILGVTVANLAHHHSRPFNAIEGIEWPFMVLFFILSGASLHTETLLHIGLIGTGYIVFRVLGRLLGAWVGGTLSSAGSLLCHWMGVALMPQAGVALGMTLVAIEKRPDLGNIILPVVIASTIVFEVIGPIFTRMGLVRAGDAYRK